MPEKVTVIPKELLCLQEEGPKNFYLVPFPALNKKTLTVDWNRSLQEHVTENIHFILRHPESNVGVQCLRKSYTYHGDGDQFFIEMHPFRRVIITDIREVDNGLEFAKWADFAEKNLTRERFLAQDFQQKIDELRELAAKFILSQFFGDDLGEHEYSVDVYLPPHRLSEAMVGLFIDHHVCELNLFIEEGGVKEGLIYLLEEDDVESRLSAAIGFFKMCVEIDDSSKDDSRHDAGTKALPARQVFTRQELVNDIIFSDKDKDDNEVMPDKALTEEEDVIDRAGLVRQLISDDDSHDEEGGNGDALS